MIISPELDSYIDNNVVSLDKDKLRELVNDELSDVTLIAKEKNTNKEYSICDDKRMLLLGGLDENKEYEIYHIQIPQ